jgi:hypothetical protein
MRVLVFLGTLAICTAIKEKKTGIDFPWKSKVGKLTKLGSHAKGSEHDYAVALYRGFFRLPSIVIKMNMNESAKEMTDSLTLALAARSTDINNVRKFHRLLLESLPDVCYEGQELGFEIAGAMLWFSINGKRVGNVVSRSVAVSFPAIFTDDHALSYLEKVVAGQNKEEKKCCGSGKISSEEDDKTVLV